jgi:hypothetical protein
MRSYCRYMSTYQQELGTLKRLISQADLILSATDLPDAARCRELLSSAIALTGDLMTQSKLPAAKALGSKGGTVTVKRGSEYFRQLAAKRKTNAGGRPRKESD